MLTRRSTAIVVIFVVLFACNVDSFFVERVMLNLCLNACFKKKRAKNDENEKI